MVHFVLIRPATTDYDQQERIQGNLDIPLNDEGRAECSRLVEQLGGQRIETVYAPESQPAEGTAQLLGKGLKARFRRLDHLENIDLGLWQGMLIGDVRHKQPRVYRQWQEQPETVCPPEGEMLSAADERVRQVLARILKRHREGTVALVLPEPLLSLARRFLTHAELGDLWESALPPAGFEAHLVDPELVFAPSG